MNNERDGIHVRKIDPLDLLVFEIGRNRNDIILTDTSVILSIQNIASIIKFLVMNKVLNHKILEGILEDYYTFHDKEFYE